MVMRIDWMYVTIMYVWICLRYVALYECELVLSCCNIVMSCECFQFAECMCCIDGCLLNSMHLFYIDMLWMCECIDRSICVLMVLWWIELVMPLYCLFMPWFCFDNEVCISLFWIVKQCIGLHSMSNLYAELMQVFKLWACLNGTSWFVWTQTIMNHCLDHVCMLRCAYWWMLNLVFGFWYCMSGAG